MPDEMNVQKGAVRLMVGDITDLETEAIVFYARPDLALGSGFGGAISGKGGPKIQEELNKLAPVQSTDAVITSGGNLKAKYVIHAVGPKFQEEDLERKLRDTIVTVLRKAEKKGIRSLAFPAMGAGFYGIPLATSAEVMLSTFAEQLKKDSSLKEVVICVLDSREYGHFQKKMEKI